MTETDARRGASPMLHDAPPAPIPGGGPAPAGPPPGPLPSGQLGFPFGGGPQPTRTGPRNRERMEGVDRGGWHANWVAVALSTDLLPGAVLGRDLYGERILLTRASDGTASALTAHCRHFGADLTVGGRLGQDCVVCPFHAWTYDVRTGRGLSNALGEALPDGADLFAFPTRERHGLVWVFNGPDPDREPPGFHGVDDHDLVVLPFQVRTPAYNEPWVQFSNSHDFTHLRFLHDVELVSGPDDFHLGDSGGGHRVVFRFPHGRTYDHVVRVHGTNTIMLAVTVDEGDTFYNMFTAVQADDHTMVQTMITATPAALPPQRQRELLAESATYGQTLAADDDPVLWNARFVPDTTQHLDREILLYIDYVRGFPRHDPYARYRR